MYPPFGIFLFFVSAIGVQETVKAVNSNREVLAELEAQGVPAEERQQDSRLINP